MFTVAAVIYIVLTFFASLAPGRGRALGLSRQGQGVLMLIACSTRSRASSTPTRCCSCAGHGHDPAMTADRLRPRLPPGLRRSSVRQTPGLLGRRARWSRSAMSSSFAASRSSSSSISSCSSSRLHAQASLFAIAVIGICLLSTAYTAEIIRAGLESVPRQQIEAGIAMNFSRWQTLTPRDRAAILARDPAAGVRLHGGLHQGHRAGLADRRGRTHLRRQGAE